MSGPRSGRVGYRATRTTSAARDRWRASWDVRAPSSLTSVTGSIRSSPAAIDVRQLGTRRLPRRLAAAARPGRRQGGRRPRHAAAAGAPAGLHRRTAHRAARTAGRRHPRRRHRPRRQDHLARARTTGRLSDHRAGRAARCGQLRSAPGGIADQGVRRPGPGHDPGRRPVRGVGAGRRRAARTQGRRHRRPGGAGDDAARVRAQLRLRPGRVRHHRAVRHRATPGSRRCPPNSAARSASTRSARRSPTPSATPWTACLPVTRAPPPA